MFCASAVPLTVDGVVAQVLGVVALQCVMAWAVRDMAWWKVVALAYLVGGTASQNLFCAQHELSHFLAHRRLAVNRALSLISQLPAGGAHGDRLPQVPPGAPLPPGAHLLTPPPLGAAQQRTCAWRLYALQELERQASPAAIREPRFGVPGYMGRWVARADTRLFYGQGVDGWDVDLPTRLEANYICNLVAKLLWAMCVHRGVRPATHHHQAQAHWCAAPTASCMWCD